MASAVATASALVEWAAGAKPNLRRWRPGSPPTNSLNPGWGERSGVHSSAHLCAIIDEGGNNEKARSFGFDQHGVRVVPCVGPAEHRSRPAANLIEIGEPRQGDGAQAG